MAQVQVLNVGDGACTLIRPTKVGDPVTILDCGTWRTHGQAAAAAAANALGGSLANLQTMIVTHFDADHWEGLNKLAPLYANTNSAQTKPIRLIYPGMPRDLTGLPPMVFALISTARGTGVRAMDLRSAWSAESVHLDTRILRAGHVFEASGVRWRVLWPPQQLPPRHGNPIKKSLDELKVLAKDMKDAGFPLLQDNLRDAYSMWNEQISGAKSWDEHPADFGESPHFLTDPAEEGDDLEEEGVSTPEEIVDSWEYAALPDNHPKRLKERFKELSEKLAAANNFLSLVVEQEATFISFGDIQGWALNELLKHGGVREHYCVVLAPHHGTVEMPYYSEHLFPSACVCVAQAGDKHSQNPKHLDPRNTRRFRRHDPVKCLNTNAHGVVTVMPHWGC